MTHSVVLKRFMMAATGVAAVSLSVSLPAQATHIFFQNVKIDGVLLENTTGFTDPIFNIKVGDSLTFSAEVFSLDNDTSNFVANFFKDGGTLNKPSNKTLVYSGTGTPLNPVLFSFARAFNTIGTFEGRLFLDLTSSGPDYVVPSTGEEVEERTFPFSLNVRQATQSVPEPASALSLLAFGAVAAWKCQKKQLAGKDDLN